MFKITDSQTNTAIVILDPEWRNRLDELRTWGRAGRLICPGCKQPVYVRAGDCKRWHFAHKHLQNCPYERESPLLLETRAIFYEWLITKFPGKVTLEKAVNDPAIPRPIDCWVDAASGSIAYWIIEAGTLPDNRDDLKHGLERLGAAVNLVFVAEFLSPNKTALNGLDLTTTERAFLRHRVYDNPFQTNLYNGGQTLHYLAAETTILTTYRALRLVHSPKLFGAGDVLSHPLSQVQISPKTGEFVHPNEHDRLLRFQKEHPP